MKRADYPEPFAQLTAELRRLPGIGSRSAERIALWIAQSPDAHPERLAQALLDVKEKLHPCRRCGFFATEEECIICRDPARDGREICIVEQATDILALERSGAFHGRYHALGGRLSPLEGVGPENLRIAPLLDRIANENPPEIILALSADVEGEATASYLAELLAPHGVSVTRIAQGIPAGGGLDFADDLTLARALAGRHRIGGQNPG